MNLTANYPTNVDIKEKLYGFEFIHSRDMITLDINDTNMEFKQIITIINEIPNDVTNIKSKAIKQGVIDLFSHSCLLLQSIYNSKPKDCVIIIFVKISRLFNSLNTGYIPEKVLPETRYPSYNTLKFPFHHLFYTCHCMAPKAPPDPKNPSLVSLSQSLIQGCIESNTRVHIREHEQAEHMSFGADCVWPEPARIYTFSVSVCLWLKTYIYVIGRQRVKEQKQ